MQPSIGRIFSKGEDEFASHVAVLSAALWRSRFASSPDAIGKTIPLGGQSYTIVGVMPEDFDYPLATDVWVPLVLTQAEKSDRVYHSLLVIGKLKRDVSAAQANAELRAAASVLEQQYPKTNAGWSATVEPLRQTTEAVTNRFIVVLAVASLFLLLLAAANAANIQLAQAMNRRKTIVIEASLGASRLRIARSLCLQSLLLALAGGAAALIAVYWMKDWSRQMIPVIAYRFVPGLRQLRIDSNIILATLGISVVTGMLCSVPAIAHLLGKRSSPALSEALQQGSRSIAGNRRQRMRDPLVVGEVAMALLPLVAPE